MGFNFKSFLHLVTDSLEHQIDHVIDLLGADATKEQIIDAVNHAINKSPLAAFGGIGIALIDGEIESILAHNTGPDKLVKLKAYVHARLLVK